MCVCVSSLTWGHVDRRMGQVRAPTGGSRGACGPSAPARGSTQAGAMTDDRQRGHSNVKGNIRGQWPCSAEGRRHSVWMVPRLAGTWPQAGPKPKGWGETSSDAPQERGAEPRVSDYLNLFSYLRQLWLDLLFHAVRWLMQTFAISWIMTACSEIFRSIYSRINHVILNFVKSR